MTEPRICYVILDSQRDENGYIPSLCTEGEPGHAPMTGRGEFASPWYWGKTYEEASAVCAAYNLKHFRLDAEAADVIVASTMRGTI